MLKLVSYTLCPFAQRARITLIYKQVEHEVVYVNLADPPDWFLKSSPLKRVPIILINGVVLFESFAINEYIDDAYPNKLHPKDPVLRAENRGWIGFGDKCMWSAFNLSTEETENEFNQVRDDLLTKFDALEKVIQGGSYFNSEGISLVDVNYAPLFQRLEYLHRIKPVIFDRRRHPKIWAWKNHLLAMNAFKESCVPHMEPLYHELLWKRRGHISQFLDESVRTDVERSVY